MSADSPLSRRTFLAGAGLAAQTAASSAPQAGTPAVDLARLVARADLVYDAPVPRSEEGIPVGNGHMGSLVWTSPRRLRFQINRADVYANNSATNSFFERHNDYCGGCGFLDLDFGGPGDQPFPESGFRQHLSVYDGMLAIDGKGVQARIVASPHEDVMAVAVESGAGAAAILRMLRYETKYFGNQLETFARDHVVSVQNRNHTAASRLVIDEGTIALTQEFREGRFCCKSALAVAVVGRNAAPRFLNETEVEISASGAAPSFTFLVASAASFDPDDDVLARCRKQLQDARAKGFAAIARETREWWRAYWSRAFVQLHSADGTADFVEQNYTWYLYLMAASSRGSLPPKFNGMLWNTGGDLRTWGAQHWFANLSCYYEALPAANRWEQMDPMFDMYSGMYQAAAAAARQQWDSQGIYIPETTYFDGLDSLPEEIAAEMRDLYLLRKPWEQRSARFLEYARNKHPHSSRWNWMQAGSWVDGKWVVTERGFGPYGAVNHIFGSTAKIAYLYWRRYEFTLDTQWLRTRAYPMLRGAVEFYRHHPNVRKESDGKYHIHWANSNESVYGARDTDEDLSAMRGVTAALLRAAEILDADSAIRPAWREFLDNLAPLPTSDDPNALKPADYTGPRVFVRGLKPAIKSGGLLPDANSLPMWWFDLCHVESRDRQTLETARATFAAFFRNGITARTPVSVLSKTAIAAAALGNADAVRILIPNQIRALAPERSTAYKNGGVLANRMTLREGPQALDAQRLGRAAEALHLALLQSYPPAPGEDPILHIFPSWPRDWDARYTLAARGGFLVSAAMANGQVQFVEIVSQAGSRCRVRNPYNGGVRVIRNGGAESTMTGTLLEFTTRKGEIIRLLSANIQRGSSARELRA